jgi:hypothetical protein
VELRIISDLECPVYAGAKNAARFSLLKTLSLGKNKLAAPAPSSIDSLINVRKLRHATAERLSV